MKRLNTICFILTLILCIPTLALAIDNTRYDLDGSGSIDTGDLYPLIPYITNLIPIPYPPYDFNNDSQINILDANYVTSNIGALVGGPNSNLLANPSFEAGDNSPLNWTFVTNNGSTPEWDTNVSHSGARSVKIQVAGIKDNVSGYPRSDIFQLLPNTTYNFSAWGMTEGAGGTYAPAVRLVELDAGNHVMRETALVFDKGTNPWGQKSIIITTASNTRNAYIYSEIKGGYGNFWVDDMNYYYKRVEIGNWNYNPLYGNVDPKLSPQNDKRLTWDLQTDLSRIRPNTTVVWESAIYTGYPLFTNSSFVQSRFDLAENNKDKNWTYGTYLLLEELFHPSIRAEWFPRTEGIAYWDIEGNATFAGVNIMHIKPWYIEKYGSWNQSWWDSVAGWDGVSYWDANKTVKRYRNKFKDPIVWNWSVYSGYNLHKAWDLHMKSLGKKSAIVGIIGMAGMGLFETYTYPSPMWEYATQNYDLIFTYQYPECITAGCSRPINKSIDEVKQLREKYNFKGKIIHILTSIWPGGVGTANETVQFEEFKAVYPYVDVVMVMPFADVQSNPPKIPYPPRLINFSETLNLINI